MMTDEYNILTCPSCGMDACIHQVIKGYAYRRWYVGCLNCGRATTYYKTKLEAIRAWNKEEKNETR